MATFDLSAVRLLVLLNPGRMSRHWVLGIARAAESMGVLSGTLEMQTVWDRINGSGIDPAVVREVAGELRDHCAARGVTHVVSYTHNGVFDTGVWRDEQGVSTGFFAAMGLTHLLLWSDHPNWAFDGAGLEPAMRSALAHPRQAHFVKSAAAADELAAVTGWPNVHALHMAEDPRAFEPVPFPERGRVFDAVAIAGDRPAVPDELAGLLDDDDPDPRSIIGSLGKTAVAAARARLHDLGVAGAELVACDRLVSDWVEARAELPRVPFFQIADQLEPYHPEATAFLRSDPQRWYAAVRGAQTATAWRRPFWMAWLARRAELGVFGSRFVHSRPAQTPEQIAWAPNAEQARVYARGASGVNINAGHDEAGLTHKPFQIAAAGSPIVHHDTRHIRQCFEPGEECLVFERGPELLDAVRSLADDPERARRMGEAARARLERDHTWAKRLEAMLRAADTGESAEELGAVEHVSAPRFERGAAA